VKVIRDPLWNNIRIDPLALKLIDTAAFQRLRYVRQLGVAFLVYPGASHSRFEHALGTYHLARRALLLLEERGDLRDVAQSDRKQVAIAALLHDIGHYPFSHALEEIGALNHEAVAQPLICAGPVGDILRAELGDDAPRLIVELIRGRSEHPLQGLISGSLDLDKIEYLRRDALMCGVPYGDIDADRLLNSLVLLQAEHAFGIGVQEKGLSAVESLLFAKYQMYRNVYWHHAVRSATAMYKRLVSDALDAGSLSATELAGFTDEGLLFGLEAKGGHPLLNALRERRLYKRAIEIPAVDLADVGEWIADDWRRTMDVERRMARTLGLAPAELLLDYPAKTEMLGLDLPVLRRDGRIEHLTQQSTGGAINLPKLSEDLYRSARWLRVFTARPVALNRETVLGHLQ
jgi:HD superfamily phosphohydrolase